MRVFRNLAASMKLCRYAVIILCVVTLDAAPAQNAALGEAEVQKCEDRISSVQRDALNKYEGALADLQVTLQKAADLDGALMVRSERERLSKEQALSAKDFVTEPKALRALQAQTAARMQELITQLISETVPKLVELKKQLTIAGKLDEAVAVRSAIEKLQNSHLSSEKVSPGSMVAADVLVVAYSGDRVRADKIYKGQKVVVHGIVGAFRQDPANEKNYQVFLTGGSSGGWVQCTFSSGENRFREEKAAYNVPVLVIIGKDGDTSRLQKGSGLGVRGTCEGWDEAVRLVKCEVAR